MAYEVTLTSQARKQLTRVLHGASAATRSNLSDALDTLQQNPYPTNPNVTLGTIKRLSGNRRWRIRVDREYRMVYRIDQRQVVVERIAHRKEVYRGL